ncbi:hypothetical protein DY000_02039505 [Brassica cretica]|uniref:Uncharacterized protein n=1 Tax=Brassica cretica TaxID=69181 RepID=A0ABQ7BL65_BRACR|nr:hypothetical protein DY000_02039505 [Brassica cretica]
MSSMDNPTLHRHAVHGLQGATPSSCLHDLVPFAGPRHDSPKRLVLELVGYLKPYSTSDLLIFYTIFLQCSERGKQLERG